MTLGSADIAGLISGTAAVAASLGATLDSAAFSADLPVTGAQSGTVHMTKTITDLTAGSFSASGKLKLTKAGTVKIDIPSKFGVAFSASGTVVLDVACTLVTKPAPVAQTLTVTQGSSSSPQVCTTPTPTTTAIPTVTPTITVTPTVTVTPTTENGNTTVTPTVTVTPTTTVTPTVTVTPTTTASPTPCASTGGGSEGSGGSEEGSGTPAGGVSTGGGVAPGANVALGMGGAALLLAGGGLMLRGARRGSIGRVRAGSLSGWWRRLTRGR